MPFTQTAAGGQCEHMAIIDFEEQPPHPPGTNDFHFHRKQFLAERVGWLLMAVYLAWALLGGFGEGWISQKQASNDAQSCAIDYERFGRREAPSKLRVQLQPDASPQDVALRLNREFVDRVRIERITPAYQKMEGDEDSVTLSFTMTPQTTEHSFLIEYKPLHVGTLHVAVQPAGAGEVAFDQFIYP
jgi:hypothetical protein